ncbi:MAG: FAD-dependent oxidoreductase, partial [Phycisphaerae bacterium]|nr:FAD-dependent oxidoreductase [Phycisphaerae bacterium]
VELAVAQGAREVHQFEILPESQVSDEGPEPLCGQNIHRRWCVSVKRFDGDGRLSNLQAVRVEYTPSPVGQVAEELPGSDFNIKADMAVLALGYDAVVDPQLASQLDLATDAQGRARVRDYATDIDGVFAAGDLESGAGLVVDAIHAGREVAETINTYLTRGRDASGD